MHVRHPVWLIAVTRPGSAAFALLFALESIARATLATTIPLQAYALLESGRAVSVAFMAVGAAGLAGSFAIPFLIRRMQRRWVYSLGALCLIAAAILLSLGGRSSLLGGMVVRVFGVACLNITLSLYIMDYIQRGDLVRSEPLRLTMSAGAWTLCPSLGVYLYARHGPLAADGLSAAAAVVLIATFWSLRLGDNPAIAAARRPPPDPLASIGRFLAQPRLRLAWLIAFGRSAWWGQFFTFAPLYMVTAGQGEMAAAGVVSLGNAMLFLNIAIGRFAARFGVRLVIVAAFATAGVSSLAAALAVARPWLAATFLLAGAFACSALDAVGNIPFLRSVRAHERAQMTTVFRTYLDMSDLLPPALFALLLSSSA
jgi:predicted MFS family arabinose efflux permease